MGLFYVLHAVLSAVCVCRRMVVEVEVEAAEEVAVLHSSSWEVAVVAAVEVTDAEVAAVEEEEEDAVVAVEVDVEETDHIS